MSMDVACFSRSWSRNASDSCEYTIIKHTMDLPYCLIFRLYHKIKI